MFQLRISYNNPSFLTMYLLHKELKSNLFNLTIPPSILWIITKNTSFLSLVNCIFCVIFPTLLHFYYHFFQMKFAHFYGRLQILRIYLLIFRKCKNSWLFISTLFHYIVRNFPRLFTNTFAFFDRLLRSITFLDKRKRATYFPSRVF